MALTQIKGSNIEDGTVVAADVADNAVTGAKIAMGSDAAGDILTYNGTDYIRLAKGTAEQVLKMNSGATAVEWGTDAGGIAIPGSSVAGDTLYHNGSIYTRLAKGTASQVLTMNAGATAPEWAAAAGGGAWTKISHQTPSTAASVSFTGLTSTYTTYAVKFNFFGSYDGSDWGIRTSTNNGSSYDSGASDYLWMFNSTNSYNGGNAVSNDQADTKIPFIWATGTASGENGSGIFYIYHPTDASRITLVTGHGVSINHDGYGANAFFNGARNAAAAVDAFQVYPLAGTVTGDITLYGISHT